MKEKESAPDSALTVNNRRDLRSPVEIIAELFVSEGVRFKAAVHDLSASGFRIETANHIPVGRLVYLTIPGLQSLQARVAWNEREHYGCTFSKPLHSATCNHLSTRFPKLFT